MKFKRDELIKRLEAHRQAIIDRTDRMNKENAEAFQQNKLRWMQKHREDLRELAVVVANCLKEDRPLTSEDLPSGLHRGGGYLSTFPPGRDVGMNRPGTGDLDAAIAVLKAAIGDEVTVSELQRSGIRISRWLKDLT